MNGRLYRGIITGLNEAMVVDRATHDRLIAEHPSSVDVLKPFLRGRDVKRWRVQFADQYLIKIESSENKRHPWTGESRDDAERTFATAYPAIYQHLRPYRDALIHRDDQGRFFWELRSCAFWSEFAESKIVIPAIVQHVEYAADFEGFITNDKTSFCITGWVHYLLGVLNSKVLWWYIRQTAASRQGGFYEFKPMYVSTATDCANRQPKAD
ncbi:TaqI-like C-terminal specificity domain-containing protein [Candidatus Amarolinea dominans]|uniref:TaqI-like C-terminal specificity domain-containing protein n=1 Tax=Candidatus Amarolinea dominans TaxID=3140696 RepID=UPI0031CC6648